MAKRKADEAGSQEELARLELGLRLRRVQWAVTEAIQECELSESYCEAERLALHTAGMALELAIRLDAGELPPEALKRLKSAKAELDGIPRATKGKEAHPRIMALGELDRLMGEGGSITPVLVCSCFHFCADQFRRGATWIDKSKGPIQFSDEQLAAAQDVIGKWKHKGKWEAVNRLLAYWQLNVPESNGRKSGDDHPLRKKYDEYRRKR